MASAVPLWLCLLAGVSMAGCAMEDDDDVRTVRLEFANTAAVGIGTWSKGLDEDGSILVHLQAHAEPGETRSHEQRLVVSSLARFEAAMSLTGEPPRKVSVAFDPVACRADPVVFRVVARGGDLAGPEYQASVNCP